MLLVKKMYPLALKSFCGRMDDIQALVSLLAGYIEVAQQEKNYPALRTMCKRMASMCAPSPTNYKYLGYLCLACLALGPMYFKDALLAAHETLKYIPETSNTDHGYMHLAMGVIHHSQFLCSTTQDVSLRDAAEEHYKIANGYYTAALALEADPTLKRIINAQIEKAATGIDWLVKGNDNFSKSWRSLF